MEREDIIQLIIYSLLGIGGILTIVFTRNIATLNFVATECQTFGGAMLAFARWLIIPLSAVAISFLTLIPSLFDLEVVSKVLIVLELLALAALAAYYTFYVNADWSVSTLAKVLNTIAYIISFVWILAWMILVIFIPLLIVEQEIGAAVIAFLTIVFTGFLMGCAGHMQVLINGKLAYSIPLFITQAVAAVGPIVIVVMLYKEYINSSFLSGGGYSGGGGHTDIYIVHHDD